VTGADPVAGFIRSTFTHDGRTREVYRGGRGPAVLVIPEIPGLHPGMFDFARRLVDRGLTTYLPSLFGTAGRPISGGYTLGTALRLCVAREFTILAANRTSPVVRWLRALAAHAHEECGGPGVGAVGMCFTGGYALAMMVDERMLAPVLSQPALPAPLGSRRRAAVGLSDADLARVRERAAGGVCVLGLRFTADRAVPAERFETLRRELGDAFTAIEIDSSPSNRYGIPRNAHSVLTVHLTDEPGHPTREALDRVLAFLAERLGTAGTPPPGDGAVEHGDG
jgi:dienelactone hydrolase